MNGFGNQNKSKENARNKVNLSKEQIINQAFHFHSKGNFDEAIKCYTYLINRGFKDYRVFFNYAIIEINREKYPNAEILIRKAIELKPNFAEGYYNLGCILTNLSKFKEAESATRKAIELNPNHYQAYSNLGSILNQFYKFKEAELAMVKAIELKPDYVMAHINLGEILITQGKLNEGKQSLLKAIELNPKYGKSYYHLSKFFSRKENHKEAFSSITSAYKYDPNNHVIQGEYNRIKNILDSEEKKKVNDLDKKNILDSEEKKKVNDLDETNKWHTGDGIMWDNAGDQVEVVVSDDKDYIDENFLDA